MKRVMAGSKRPTGKWAGVGVYQWTRKIRRFKQLIGSYLLPTGSQTGVRDFLSFNMSEEQHMGAQPKMETTARIPAEINTKLRALAHDLSNSLETIMQASYLLAQMKLDENAKRWSDMIDQAGRDAARINREIREILRGSA